MKKYLSVLNPPKYGGQSFQNVECKLEDCECPSVRQILHRHVSGMPQLGNVYNEYDENEPIIGNGIDEFDLLDAQIARRAEILAARRKKQSQPVQAPQAPQSLQSLPADPNGLNTLPEGEA